MQLRLGLTLALSALCLAGCSTLGISNGSLDYKNTTTVEPLNYPEGATVRPATPLYPAPIVEQLAIQNAPNFDNKRGNRFEMPRPEQAKITVSSDQATTLNESVGRPQLLTDGNGNPLIKIDGNSATIWQYTGATLSSLNYKTSSQSKKAYETTVKIENQTYILRLTSVGTSNTLALFNADNTFADKEKAAELLSQIYQNWPA